MASSGESSSTPMEWTEEKPVVVRVKRKSFQSRLDAFWLEINERPSKSPLLDFQKLSIGDELTNEKVGGLKKRKVFVHHVETLSSSEATIERLRSFVPFSTDAVEGMSKGEEHKETAKTVRRKEDPFSTKARDQEILAQSARFEQIRKNYGISKEASHDEEVKEICRFYDVVRVDVEERTSVVQERVISLEEQRMLNSYLPLLKEYIPSAVKDLESDIRDYVSKTDEYVYDYYTVMNDMDLDEEESLSPFPLVTVEDEDFNDGLDDESDYESLDSNAEAHPRNEYPDEISEEEEDGEESEEESNESEEDEEDDSSSSSELNELRHEFCEDEYSYYEDGPFDAFDSDGDIGSSYFDDDEYLS